MTEPIKTFSFFTNIKDREIKKKGNLIEPIIAMIIAQRKNFFELKLKINARKRIRQKISGFALPKRNNIGQLKVNTIEVTVETETFLKSNTIIIRKNINSVKTGTQLTLAQLVTAKLGKKNLRAL